MGLLDRGLALVLCALLVFTLLPTPAAATEPTEDPRVPTFVAPQVSDNPEVFRIQLLEFLQGMSDALVVALDHPVIGPRLRERMQGGSVAIPLPPQAFVAVAQATPDEIEQLRQAFALAPGILIAPAVLRAGVQIAPVGERLESLNLVACSDMYNDYNQIPGLTQASKDLTIANNVIQLLKIILGTASGVLNAAVTTCESPIDIPLSWAQIPLIIVVGVVDLVTIALSTATDSVSFQIVDLWRCINLANCPPQGFTERFRPDTSSDLKGRGCDERDNNCAGGIDEKGEDVFPPEVTIDAALSARCFVDSAQAESAARLAVHAGDDCTELSASPNAHQGALNVVYSRGSCLGSIAATATDLRGNADAASTLFAVDDVPPTIGMRSLTTCQPSVAAARQALKFMAMDDCGTPKTTARVVEKECVADFEFEAEDACGNRTAARQSVRIDDSPPAVKVQTLLLPTFEGRYCFGAEASAIATVAEAAAITDNCSTRAELTLSTVAQSVTGSVCDRRIVTGATDACTLHSEESVLVRLDAQVPTVSCTVQKPILWPADSTLVNVGFQYQLQDNCGASDVKLQVAVTSDEPTSFNLPVGGTGDPSPDATVQYGADGRPSAILLRAERQQTTSADGRAYRIRLTATDACGNLSQSDCWVTVPKVMDGTGSQLTNTGQRFDATVVN